MRTIKLKYSAKIGGTAVSTTVDRPWLENTSLGQCMIGLSEALQRIGATDIEVTKVDGPRKPLPTGEYIINEAEGDRHAGTFKSYEKAVKAMKKNYDEEDFERCQPSIGMCLDDGTVTYDF